MNQRKYSWKDDLVIFLTVFLIGLSAGYAWRMWHEKAWENEKVSSSMTILSDNLSAFMTEQR